MHPEIRLPTDQLTPNPSPASPETMEGYVRRQASNFMRPDATDVDWLVGRWIEELADAMAALPPLGGLPPESDGVGEFLDRWRLDVARDPYLDPALRTIVRDFDRRESRGEGV